MGNFLSYLFPQEQSPQTDVPQTLSVVGKLSFSEDRGQPFVCIDIISIDGEAIEGSNQKMLDVLEKHIPEIEAHQGDDTFDVKEALSATENPVGDEDRAHISVLYHFAFSKDEAERATQIETAKKAVENNQKIALTLNLHPTLVTAASALTSNETTFDTTAEVTKVPTLGDKRNTVLTFALDEESQETIRNIGCIILNDTDFKGNTDRSGIVRPYHLSVAQAKIDDDIFSVSHRFEP